jgi:hypothetical protein
MLGQFAGLEKGTKGKGLGIGLTAGSLALGLAGDIASGIGMSKVNRVAQDYYRKKLRGIDVNDYESVSQSGNSNGIGGREYRSGGVFLFPDGGTMPAEPIETMVAEALQNGVPPQEIIKSLVSQGVAEDQATQMINSISQPDQESQEGQEEQNIPVEKLLTGDVMKGLSPNSPIKPNAEVEKKEALKFPDGSVEKVDGPSHEEGGVKVNLPEGTKILSDDTKIDKKDIKKFRKDYDLNVSENDTYASVLEKYSKKLGLAKLNQEQEEVFKMLKGQLENKSASEGTVRVNTEYLAKKIKDIEDKKAPKEAEKQKFFDTLFNAQESRKKPENKEGEFKYGGEFEAVCKKMGIDPEHAKSIMEGSMPKYPGGGVFKSLSEQYKSGTLNPEELKAKMDQEYKAGNIDEGDYVTLGNMIPGNPTPTAKPGVYTGTYNENEYSTQQRVAQKPGEQAYGQPKTKEAIILNLYKNFPDIIAKDDVFGQYLDKDKLKSGQVVFTKELPLNKVNSSVLNMQKQVDTRMKASANDIIKNKDKFDAATVDRATKYLKEETFSGDFAKGTPIEQQIRSYDQKMGNFTAGRYSIGLNVITPEESKILANKGIYTLNQLDDETLKSLSPGTQAKVQDLKKIKSTDADYSLNTYTPIVDKATPPATENTKEGELKNLIKNTAVPKVPGMFYHPSQVQLAPTPLTATYMGDIQTQYVDPTRIGIENNLQASSDQMQVIASQLDNLPPSQRASALSSLLATTQTANNQAITNANMVNAQAEQQADVFNIGQFDRNQQNDFNIKQNYVNKTEQAQAILEENMRNYFNFNQKVAMNNKAIDDKYNLMASVFDYKPNFYGNQIQFDPNDEFQIQKRNALALQMLGSQPQST